MIHRIPVAGPSITEREAVLVVEAVASGWYNNAQVWQQRFEQAFAKHLGVRHAAAVNSCTAAIHLALLAHNLGPGDEVIVPDCTWIATAAPICYVGATPVFADMDERNWCLSPASLAECLTPRTRAVIAVDLYGGMPDMEAIQTIARQHDLLLIEDAAEAIGAEYHGRKAGSLGDVGVFSFHGSKTLTTGEGGMLVTNDDAIYERVLRLRDHGRPPGDRLLSPTEIGCKYRMSAMQAALGLAQLERLPELVERKRTIFGWYRELLGAVSGLTFNPEPPGTRSSYWLVTVLVDPHYGLDGRELMERLGEQGIDTRPFFHPLSSLLPLRETPQAKRARERNQTAYRLAPRGINLPTPLNLTRDEAEYVAETLRRILRKV